MRCTQIIGLPEDAKRFIDENVSMIPGIVCPECGCACTVKLNYVEWDDQSAIGMFEDGPKLLEYRLLDGSVVREHVQAAPWSGGPCIFLDLRDVEGKVLFQWSQDEIDSV